MKAHAVHVWLVTTAAAILWIAASDTASQTIDTSLTTFNTEFPKFMEGVGTPYVDNSWESNAFLLWSQNGFVVARSPTAARNGQTNMLPTVVAVPLSSGGRIVAFGNFGYITSGCCGPVDNVKRLVRNSIKWLAAADPSRTFNTIGVVVQDKESVGIDMGIKTIAEGIAKEDPWFRFNMTLMSIDEVLRPELTRGISFFYINSYTNFTDAHVKAILDIMKAKPARGLLVAGRYFFKFTGQGYQNPQENALVDLSINRILWPLGLAYTTQIAYAWEHRPSTTPTNWMFYNTLYLTTRLREAQGGGSGARPIEPAAYSAANWGTKLFVDTLSARTSNGSRVMMRQFYDVWKTLEGVRPKNFLGVGPSSTLPIDTSPPDRVLDAALDAAYIRNADMTYFRASSSAAAYPGLLQPPSARLEVINVTIDGTFLGAMPSFEKQTYFDSAVWRSTGLYAPPGVRVKAFLITPGIAVGKGLKLQIGMNPDDINYFPMWTRVPSVVSTFEFKQQTIYVGSSLGGPIFILVPPGSAFKNVQFQLTNVTRAPYFEYGATDVGTWSRTICNYPGARAELAGHRVTLMVASQSIRSLADPRPTLNYWDQVVDAMDWLSNNNRTREERLTDDVDTAAGWVRHGYPVMLSRSENDLLPGHPSWSTLNLLARNFLTFPMARWGFDMATVFVAYVKEWVEGIPVEYQRNETSAATRAAIRAAYVSRGEWYQDWYGWVAMDTYLQLVEGFGWDFYRRVFAAYQARRYDPEWSVMTDINFQHQIWIIITSEISGRNLINFYTAWKFPLESYTRSKVLAMKLPLWEADPMKKYM